MTFTPEKVLMFLGLNIQGDLGPLTVYKSTRKKYVWFGKAPPLNPPSPTQAAMRNVFRLTAMEWRSLTEEQRATWKSAAADAGLRCTGPALFLWWLRKRDNGALQTIARKARVSLPP